MTSQPAAFPPSLRVLPRLSMAHVLGITTLAGILLLLNLNPIAPNDFWWHLQAGRAIAETDRIPTGDALSFTIPGLPYQNYSAFWLAELGLYALYALGGPALVVFIHSLVVTSAYALLLWLCGWLVGDWRSGYRCVVLAACVGMSNWAVRPQSIGFPLCAAFLCGIYGYRKWPRPIWLAVFPVAMLIWVNSHGSFVIGLLLLTLWLVDEVAHSLVAHQRDHRSALTGLRAPLIAFAISILVCLVNPRGPGIIDYLMTMYSNSVVRNLIPEWSPTSFASLDGAIYLTVLLLSSALLIVSPKRTSSFQLLMFLAFAVLGLQARRNTVWFGLAIAPILADHLPVIGERIRRGLVRANVEQDLESARLRMTVLERPTSPLLNLVLAGVALLAALVSLPWFKHELPLPPDRAPLVAPATPIAATRFLLESRPSGRLFSDLAFSSYLIWAAQPAYPVFIDPRLEMYPPEVVTDYIRISNALGDWQQALDKYGIRVLMLNPQEQPALVAAVARSSDWEQAYRDAHAVIFVHRDRAGQ